MLFLPSSLVFLMLFFIISLVVGVILLKISTVESNVINLFLYSITGSVLVILSLNIYRLFITPIVLSENDFYGKYEVDRYMFPGVNADWQYKKYSLEIKKDNSLVFMEKKLNIDRICEVDVVIIDRYKSHRLKTINGDFCHHILSESPLIIRYPWSFHLVFNSPYYGNIYFRKKNFLFG